LTQVSDLEATLNAVPADVIVVGTPTDLTLVMHHLNKPAVLVTYGIAPKEQGAPQLREALQNFMGALVPARA
jgi:predicted GTPase